MLETFFIDLIRVFGFPMLMMLFVMEGALIGKIVPTDLILPAVVVMFSTASRDYLGILLLCSVSSTLGQLLLFRLIRSKEGRDIEEIRWLSRIPEKKLKSAEERFEQKRGYAVMVSNVIPGVRGFLTVPAAMKGMDYKVFTVCSFAGTFFFYTVLVAVGAGFATVIF